MREIWLISEEKKRKKERTTMAYIAAQFEKHFGYPRNRKNISRMAAGKKVGVDFKIINVRLKG